MAFKSKKGPSLLEIILTVLQVARSSRNVFQRLNSVDCCPIVWNMKQNVLLDGLHVVTRDNRNICDFQKFQIFSKNIDFFVNLSQRVKIGK